MTGYRPSEIIACKLKRPLNIVVNRGNEYAEKMIEKANKYMPDDIVVGDYVRVLKYKAISSENKGNQKKNIFEKSYVSSWTKTYYKVVNVSVPKNYSAIVYTIENIHNIRTDQKYRNELLKIEKPTSDVPEALPPAPIVANVEPIFNIERHMANLNEQRRGSKKAPEDVNVPPKMRMTRSMSKAYKEYNM
jgi:hypothetical protein